MTMGTHNDGKSVTVAGFGGNYWEKKAMREKAKAKDAAEIEFRSAKAEDLARPADLVSPDEIIITENGQKYVLRGDA